MTDSVKYLQGNVTSMNEIIIVHKLREGKNFRKLKDRRNRKKYFNKVKKSLTLDHVMRFRWEACLCPTWSAM